MIQPKFYLTALFCALLQMAVAQTNPEPVNSVAPALNFLKVNLTSIALKNYSLQYERVLSKKVSLAVSYRTMPVTSIPFKNLILEAVGDDPDTKDIIDRTQLGNHAITPEIRFYLGKGYGQGFYIAPFYRYVKFTSNEVPVTYTASTGSSKTFDLSGDLTAHTGGVMFGTQWLIGKHLCLDWWILGGHYGKGNGNFIGVPNTPLTPSEQQEVGDQLNDIDLLFIDKTVTVTSNMVRVKLDGPFAGVRGGINFGFRF